MPDWGSIFLPATPLAELVVRGTVTYLVLLLLMRLAGQRESGGLGITDVLLVVLVAQATAGGLAGSSESIADGVVLVVTILGWSVVLDAVSYRWPRAAALLKARPKPLIVDGRINHKVMRREFMSQEEVMSQLRLHGIRDLDMVSRAYLEPNGMISVIRHDEGDNEPPQPPPALG